MTVRAALLPKTVIFQAQINQADISYPIQEVDFDNVVVGAYTDIKPGQTILFGDTQGGDNLGRQRVRKTADSTTLYFGRSSQGRHDGEVDLADGRWITILDDHRVWSKTPYIEDDGTIRKDAEVAFQAELPPVSNVGPAMAGTIDSATDKLRVTLPPDSNNSWAVETGASISTYGWDLPGGVSLVGGYALTDSQIEVDCDPGWHWVACTVTDSNGNAHGAWVPIFARDPADDDSIRVEIVDHRKLVMGQQISLRVLDDVPASTYPDGTSVLVWEDEPSDGADRSHMIFAGWHETDDANIIGSQEGALRDVTLHCLDVAGRLDTLPGFPQEVIASDSPTVWTEMEDPDVRKYLVYLLYWHFTALEVADFTCPDLSDYPFVILWSDGESGYKQVNNLANKLKPDRVLTCNSLGQLSVVVDPMLQAPADRTVTVQASLESSDIREIRYTHQRPPRLHWRRGWAIVADSEVAANIVYCVAPGESSGQGLNAEEEPEGLTKSQEDLNACEGNRYARANAPQGLFSIVLSDSDLRGIEPAELTWVQLDLDAAWAAQRGLSFTNELGLVHEVNVRYESAPEGLVKTIELLWEREVSGPAAVTQVVEQADDGDGDDWDDDWDENPGGDDDIGLVGGQNNIALPNSDGHLYRTSDFLTPSGAGGPTWSRVDMSVSGDPVVFVVDAFCSAYLGTGSSVDGWLITDEGKIYKLEDLFGSLSTTLQFDSGRSGGYYSLEAGFGVQNWLIGAAYGPSESSNFNGTYAFYTTDGANWTEVQISSHYTIDGAGTVRQPSLYLSSKTAGRALIGAYTNTVSISSNPTSDVWQTTDYGATWATAGAPAIDQGDIPEGTIHGPWHGNPDDDLFYYTFGDFWPNNKKGYTYRYNGGTIEDISPIDGSNRPGAPRSKWSIYTCPIDRFRVAFIASHKQTDNEPRRAGWVSRDGGDSWTRILPDGTDARDVAVAGDSRDVLYIWGAGGYIRFSQDFGGAIDDRSGNIPDDFAGIGRFVGIAGGGG